MAIIQNLWKGHQIDWVRHNPRGISIGSTAPTVATNWPTQNKAYYVPIYLPYPVLVTHFWWKNGTAVAGNRDAGIFDYKTGVKLASTGSTAGSGASDKQYTALTSPKLLMPGAYWLGISSDTTTNARVAYLASSLAGAQLVGAAQETSAFPLPATITPAQQSGTFLIPFVGMQTNFGGFT